uniref:Protein kinase domain-containing protein n=1 Tax=Dracunculus medinensis TaxID=318479 RepID=A0A0N4UF66_DRAME
LLDADCRVKLADFGLARSLSSLEDYPEGQTMPELTEYVATRWYRSPEILLAAKRYTKGIDMWSLGCILGEMLLGRALFPGSSTINQIERIMNTIPRPSMLDIESIGSHYATSVLEKMPQRPRKPIELFINNADSSAIDLVRRLLIFAPHKRLNAEQCLAHPYVFQFHSPKEEPTLTYDITLPLPDHIQLTIDEYRNKLYEIIQQKKTNTRKIQLYNKTTNNLNRCTTESANIRRSNIFTNVKLLNESKKKERKAPIAQAECSDTDYETAREMNKQLFNDKQNNKDINKLYRERAQSADSRQTVLNQDSRINHTSETGKNHQHSRNSAGILSTFRKTSSSRKHSTKQSNAH